MSSSERKPKKIILLSDGTGNSAAKIFKTNVWRLYQALDLSDGDQVAYYDDGVGTSNLKIFKMLGGAFGFGLAGNVRDLYRFLCEHYQPGDHIYVFGFSRGAFTARILVDMIACCGVLDRTKETTKFSLLNWRMFRFGQAQKTLPLDTEQGLRHGVRLVHKAYRGKYGACLSSALRRVGNYLSYKIPEAGDTEKDGETACIKGACIPVKSIKFVGVWDTVAAYGLPIEEFSDFIDKYIFPLKFPDQDLSFKVDWARQALAIDDKRQSFHPVLWNEEQTKSPDQIKQVWFTGMHSNIGGGYPKDDLAFICLEWMIDEIRHSLLPEESLRFKVGMFRDIRNRAQPTGKLHDSRAGIGMSYRYMPRDIHELCNCGEKLLPRSRILRPYYWVREKLGVPVEDLVDPNYVRVSNPIIHTSVLERIVSGTDGYAPTGLPRDFSILRAANLSPPDETEGEKDRRYGLHQRAKNHIFWDRINYFFLLAIASILVLAPLAFQPVNVIPSEGATAPQDLISKLLSWLSVLWNWMQGPAVWLQTVFEKLVQYASPILPGFVGDWLLSWTREPILFFVLVVALLGAMIWNALIARNIQRLSEAAWGKLNRNSGKMPIVSRRSLVEKMTARLRQCRFCGWLLHCLSAKIAPPLFSLAATILIVSSVYRVLVYIPEIDGGICKKTEDLIAFRIKEIKEKRQPENISKKYSKIIESKEKLYPQAVPEDSVEAAARIRFGKPFQFDISYPCFKTGLRLRKGLKYRITVNARDWKDGNTPTSPAGLVNLSDKLDPLRIISVPGRHHVMTPWLALMGEIGPDSGEAFQIKSSGNDNRFQMMIEPLVTGELALYVNDAIYGWGLDLKDTLGAGAEQWHFFYDNNDGSVEITVEKDSGDLS